MHKKIIAKCVDARCCKRGELLAAKARPDVSVRMLSILCDGSAFPPLKLHARDPVLCGLGDGDALARRGVDARPHVDLYGSAVIIGVLFACESRNVPSTGLIDVINHPRCFFLALPGDPTALSNTFGLNPLD